MGTSRTVSSLQVHRCLPETVLGPKPQSGSCHISGARDKEYIPCGQLCILVSFWLGRNWSWLLSGWGWGWEETVLKCLTLLGTSLEWADRTEVSPGR